MATIQQATSSYEIENFMQQLPSLHRVDSLHYFMWKDLKKSEREKIEIALKRTWETLKTTPSEGLESIRDRVFTKLHSITARITNEKTRDCFLNIEALYVRDFRSITELSSVAPRFEEYLLDLNNYGEAPISRTSYGNMGYSMLANCLRGERRVLSFFKWLETGDEFHAHLVYSHFLDNVKYPHIQFKVPMGKTFFHYPGRRDPDAIISPQKFYLRDSFGVTDEIPEEYGHRISHIFTEFARNNIPKTPPRSLSEEKFNTFIKVKPVAIFETIPGCNFLEFLYSGYRHIDESKKNFCFYQAGALAYLDFVLGHNDRFTKVSTAYTEDPQYELLDHENPVTTEEKEFDDLHLISSNLGNVMITENEAKELTFHVIDNQITIGEDDDDESDSEESIFRTKYGTFLRKVASADNLEARLSTHMLKSWKKTITDLRTKTLDPIENLEFILTDLEKAEVKATIITGMQSMKAHLQTTIVPAWRRDCCTLKGKISKDIQNAVTERLDIMFPASTIV